MYKVVSGVLGLCLVFTSLTPAQGAEPDSNITPSFALGSTHTSTLAISTVGGPAIVGARVGARCLRMGQVMSLGGSRGLECRRVAGNKLAWMAVSSNPRTPSQAFVSENIEKCQIKDFVNYTPGVWTGGDLGYPAYGEMPALGPVNIAIIPIDFSDNPGGAAPSFLRAQMRTADRWIKQYSHGKMRYVWDFKNRWVRAPKASRFYDLTKKYIGPDGSYILNEKEDFQSREEAISQLFQAAEKTHDLSKAEFVFFVLPRNIGKKVEFGPDGRNVVVKTERATYQLGFGTSAGFSHSVGQLWHQWLHETLHSHGLIGHAPGNEYPYNIMAFDGGPGQSLTAWDTFILRWFDDRQVACFDIETLDKQRVTLTSMDVAKPGVKTAMVRLSEHEMIVIESRRKSTFTRGFPNGFYGVQAYYLNTKHDGQRYDYGLGREIEKKYFAYYLFVDSRDHGFGQPSVGRPSNLNVVAYLGDTMTYKGVRIKFSESGDHDIVEISKSSK